MILKLADGNWWLQTSVIIMNRKDLTNANLINNTYINNSNINIICLTFFCFCRDSFRPAYGKLDILVSIFPEVPHLATTATATLKSQRTICDVLQLNTPKVIAVNPDRGNIFLESKERPASGEDRLHAILAPLCQELMEKKIHMPLTLVYGTLNICAESFLFFSNNLGKKQYFPADAPQKSENRLFGQYHAQYPKHEKDRLTNDLVNNVCKARVLFVTVAFGLGIDLPSIRRIVHIGVPHTMEEYFHEIGHAGRDGLPANATMYFNSYDIRSGKNCVDAVMKELVTGKHCKRELILMYFGYKLVRDFSQAMHSCCDICAANCDCSNCTETTISLELENVVVREAHKPVPEVFAVDIQVPPLSINIVQRNQIKKALEQYMETLYFGPSCVGGVSLATGFTRDLINKTIEHCEYLVSIEAVENLLPVFSRENATVVFDIVQNFSSQLE